MKTYKPLAKQLDFVTIEYRILAFWQENRIFDRLREKNATGRPWSFQDGPITANNPMGVHHAWGRSLKDIYQRYHAMLGEQLRFQNGFDCQGLWVEVEVEKEFNFSSKKDIVAFGMARFVRACKSRVLTYAAKQTEQSIRLGYWMDWDEPEQLRALGAALEQGVEEITYTPPSGKMVTDSPERIVANLGSQAYGGSYFTFSSENNFTIWHFLKKCHEDGLLYRGVDVMPWCSRCGTGLSQMEVAEGRQIREHTSVFVRFPLLDRHLEALLVWTTTPWTLSSNVATAVNPEMTYIKVKHGAWTYYLGKGNFLTKRVRDLEAEGKRKKATLLTLRQLFKNHGGEAEVIAELPGSELLGLAYRGPFDDLEAQNVVGGITPFDPTSGQTAKPSKTSVACHRVIAWKEISSTEGTGIVHIAPGCGAEDFQLGKAFGLVNIAPLTEDGCFLDGFGPLSGKPALETANQVVAELKKRDLLVAKELYPHVYPHCWRCKTELLFRLVDGWYINMDWRHDIAKVVTGVRWIPADGEARELDWLRNMGNWLISKKRFWGLALPIWECSDPSCDWFTVIGSEQELQQKAVEGWAQYHGHSPHRPYIDAVKIQCESCGEHAQRVEDVGNPWLDAGVVPFSTTGFRSNRQEWEKWFPTDLVIECFPGQFRNWFYALLAMSVKLDGRAPFKSLLGHALVMDERGEEMHKSKSNSIAFDEAADVLGADVMRYIYASQNPSANLNFPDLHHDDTRNNKKGPHPDTEVRRKLLTFWNCFSFFISYAEVDDWRPDPEGKEPIEWSLLDRWILSRLQRLIRLAHQSFADLAVYRFMEQFEKFADLLSNWYLRRSRRRFWKGEMDADKSAAYATLYTCLTTVNRLLAPILPFLTEEIYQILVRSVDDNAPASVHLHAYPQVDEALIVPELEEQMDCVLRIKNAALNLRNQSNIKIRQPLGCLLVKPRNDIELGVIHDPQHSAQILDELNIKKIEAVTSIDSLVQTFAKPNFKTLGQRVGKQMSALKKKIEEADALLLRDRLAQDGQLSLALPNGEHVDLEQTDILFSFDAGADRLVCKEGATYVILETRITEELAGEGVARDFNRFAQNLRKDADLALTDRIQVRYVSSSKIAAALTVHDAYLKRELLADALECVETLPDVPTIKLGGETVAIVIEKSGNRSFVKQHGIDE